MRTILFRGKRIDNGEWITGFPIIAKYDDINAACIIENWEHNPTTGFNYQSDIQFVDVDPATVGQFTGLPDKNGKRIFEGDNLQWFALRRFTQQSFPELRPEIDELVITKRIGSVVFKHGAFTIDNLVDDDYGFIVTIDEIGLHSIEDVMVSIFGENRNDVFDPEEMQTDMNGNEINDGILGIEVIGNIHNN